MSNITYLYVKRHMDTGLRYLGVTTKEPYKYLGSGLYWGKHLKLHGKNIITCVIGEFTDKEECSKVALEYSKLHNVVKSVEWANLKPENAKQGWVAGMPQRDETVAKRIKANTGKKRTEETKRKIAETRIGEKHWYYGKSGKEMPWFGRKHTPESIAKMRLVKSKSNHPMFGKKRPAGFMSGENNPFFGRKHSEETKRKISESKKGMVS